ALCFFNVGRDIPHGRWHWAYSRFLSMCTNHRYIAFEFRVQRCVVLAMVLCCCKISAQINDWTKTQSGQWQEPFWSLGVLPSGTQSAIHFTNAGFKALAISPTTRSQFPQTLTISNLVVSAPSNSANLLLL